MIRLSEHEIPQGWHDVFSLLFLHTVRNVRMMPKEQVGAAGYHFVCKFPGPEGCPVRIFLTPMVTHNDEIDGIAQRPNPGQQSACVGRCDMSLPRGILKIHHIRARKERDPDSVG